MTNHTADDFRTARFAEHRTRPELNAVRNADGMWVTGERSVFLDDHHISANGGYRPAHEHNLHATDAREEEIQALRDANAGLKMRFEYLNGELALWQERASHAEAHARKAEAAPLTLDALREGHILSALESSQKAVAELTAALRRVAGGEKNDCNCTVE